MNVTQVLIARCKYTCTHKTREIHVDNLDTNTGVRSAVNIILSQSLTDKNIYLWTGLKKNLLQHAEKAVVTENTKDLLIPNWLFMQCTCITGQTKFSWNP